MAKIAFTYDTCGQLLVTFLVVMAEKNETAKYALLLICLYITINQESKSKPPAKRSQPALLRNIIVSVKPQAKKAKVGAESKPAPKDLPLNGHDTDCKPLGDTKSVLGSLAAYGDDDESGDDDDQQ